MRAYDLYTARSHLDKVTALFLKGDELEAFPEVVFALPLLQKLHIQGGQFKHIPRAIGQLKHLESLLLDNGQLTALPLQLFDCVKLRQLSLCHNELAELPDGWQQLRSLERLRLDGNQLTSLPSAIWSLPKLKSISAEKNKLKNIQISGVPSVATIKKINLSNNKISRLPPAFLGFHQLEELRLSKNKISKLPPQIGNWEKLSVLSLNHNKISELPDSLGELFMLRHCYLNYNKLSTLPDSVGRLSWLSQLELSNNRFSSFPRALVHCPRLAVLKLRHNQLQQVDASLPALRVLGLSNNALQELPNIPYTLERLDLRQNALKQLSDAIRQGVQLKELLLARNQLASLPEGLRQLRQLEYLDLSANKIDGLPSVLFSLASLKKLKGVGEDSSRKKLLRFLRICKQRTVPDKLRALAFDILENEAHSIADFSDQLLLETLLLGISELALPIRTYLLEERFADDTVNEIPPGSRVCCLGATGYGKRWQLQHASKLELEFVDPSHPKIDVLVLGRLLRAMNEEVPDVFSRMISRQQFTKWVNKKMGRIFAEQADKHKIDNLRRLLFHKEKGSQQLALQILEGGGVPQALLTDLFLAWKLGFGSGKQIENLLLQNASEQALYSMYRPLGLVGNVSAKTRLANIARYCHNNEFDEKRMRFFVEEYLSKF
jgi:Leucine-rich repeat (LRR) protein